MKTGWLFPLFLLPLPVLAEPPSGYDLVWSGEFSRDGNTYFSYANDGGGQRTWPYDLPHYLLLNLAIGGDIGGAVDDGIFPVTMDVDHVRVYQRP
jgi:hypothetical protein